MKKIDLTGQRFGKLTVIEKTDERTNSGSVIYKCKCDCGNIVNISSSGLRNKNTISCGCAMGKDLTGKTFGRLTVLKKSENKGNRRMWLCQCECGSIKIISAANLMGGKTLSCGCYQKEQTSKAKKIHGEKEERLYRIWKNMKSRCYCSNKPDYHRYGGRGIEVCEEWKDNYLAFKEWALANGYKENLSIDRIDFDRNYEPDNCRWTTQRVQARNREMAEYNKFGVPGTCLINGRYRVRIRVDGKAYYFGTYDTIEEAKEARKQAELKHWGFTNIE